MNIRNVVEQAREEWCCVQLDDYKYPRKMFIRMVLSITAIA
ncbi:hypothetical protein [Vibrio atlanticus]